MAPMTSSPSNRHQFLDPNNLNPVSNNNNSNSNSNHTTNLFGSNPSTSSIPSSNNHQIPFHSTNHHPSQLGFGFGFGSSSFSSPSSTNIANNTSTMHSFGQQNNHPSFPSPSPLLSSSTNNQQQQLASNPLSSSSQWRSTTPRKQDSKRRRDDDEDDQEQSQTYSNGNDGDEDMSMSGGNRSSSGSPGPSRERSSNSNSFNSSSSSSQSRQLLPKRMRAGLGTGLDNSIGFSRNSINQKSLGMNSNNSSLNPSSININGGIGSNSNGNGKEKVRSDDDDTSGVDLGKMLASLDKPALLSLLHSLLSTSTDPKLPSQIISLLPTPSLESVNSALDEAERAIKQSLPWGTGSRDEYVWSRVRNSLFEFVQLALGYAPFFMPKDNNDVNGNGKGGIGGGGGGSKSNQMIVHPASTFSFLQSLTIRLLRIESALPSVPRSVFNFNNNSNSNINSKSSTTSSSSSKNDSSSHNKVMNEKTIKKGLISLLEPLDGEILLSPSSPDTLISILTPTLLLHWNTLVSNLSNQVNQEGRMFGKDVVLGWGRILVSLGTSGATNSSTISSGIVNSNSNSNRNSSSNSSGVIVGGGEGNGGLKIEERAVRLAMDNIREKFERELGWLVSSVPYNSVNQFGGGINNQNVHQASNNINGLNGMALRNPKRERDCNSVGMEEEEL